MLWNPFMQTFDYRYERIGINGEQAVYEPDGSWKLVIAARDPGHPNWLSTAGPPQGRHLLPLVPREGDTGDAAWRPSNGRNGQRASSQPPAAASGSTTTAASADARLASWRSLSWSMKCARTPAHVRRRRFTQATQDPSR